MNPADDFPSPTAVLAERWRRFWFDPAPPTNLGVSRVFFFAGVLLLYAREDFAAWGAVSSAFWIPTPLFAMLHLPQLTQSNIEWLEATWRVTLFFSAVGFCTRLSMLGSFALGVYLLGLPHNFGHLFHFDGLLIVVLAILACSRAGDAWSLDALMAARRHPGQSHTSRHDSEYRWPIRMVWVMMALAFLAAGLSKLRYSGIEWVTSSNLSIVLNRAVYHVSNADPISSAGLWIARHPLLTRVLAGFTLVTELGFAAALFSRRARMVFVPAAFVLLVGIRILMGPTFEAFLIVTVFWIPWDAFGPIKDRLASRRMSVWAPAAFARKGVLW